MIDAFEWGRKGFFRPWVASSMRTLDWVGASSRQVRSSIGFRVDLELRTAYLSYAITGEKLEYSVRLQTSVPSYGGMKWWFTCPLIVEGKACGQRVRKLFLPPGARYFGCRTCHRLSYRSRNNTKYRPLFRAQAIRTRLGGSASIYDPFPPKPKGMWWKTYRRLWEQEEEHYAKYIQKDSPSKG